MAGVRTFPTLSDSPIPEPWPTSRLAEEALRRLWTSVHKHRRADPSLCATAQVPGCGDSRRVSEPDGSLRASRKKIRSREHPAAGSAAGIDVRPIPRRASRLSLDECPGQRHCRCWRISGRPKSRPSRAQEVSAAEETGRRLRGFSEERPGLLDRPSSPRGRLRKLVLLPLGTVWRDVQANHQEIHARLTSYSRQSNLLRGRQVLAFFSGRVKKSSERSISK